jgi:hypothetical protein
VTNNLASAPENLSKIAKLTIFDPFSAATPFFGGFGRFKDAFPADTPPGTTKGQLNEEQKSGIMHFTNRAFVLSADDADYADYADKNQENLRSSVKSADSRHKSLSSA